MVEKIDIEIGLDGGAEVENQFRAIGEAIGSTVATITKLGAALAVAGIATAAASLVKFAAAASETEQALTQLQKVSGQSFSNLSKLASVFAQGGTELKKFASEFGNLSEKIASAGEQAAKQDAVSKQAEDIAKGLKVTSSGAITLDERVKALLETLSRVPPEDQWLKLADIFKSLGNNVERARIGQALGLSPESIATLSQGSEKIKELQAEAEKLGLTLTTSNQQALQQMAQQWNEFSSLLSTFFQKMGAAAAPAFATILQAGKEAMSGIVSDFQNLPFDQAVANLGDRLATGFSAIFEVVSPIIVKIGNALGVALVDALATAVKSAISSIFANLGAELEQNWQILLENLRRLSQNLGLGGGPAAAAGGGGGATPGMAGGGLMGGRGTGTSDSNLAWLSRGEFVINAAAVRRFGSGFFAALNAMRVPGFALGGLVPRAIPAFATGGLAGGSHVTIQFPGLPAIGGLRASADVVDQLHRAAALAQVRSGGRKPSRYS